MSNLQSAVEATIVCPECGCNRTARLADVVTWNAGTLAFRCSHCKRLIDVDAEEATAWDDCQWEEQ